MQRDKAEPVQVECPRCRHTEIIYIPDRSDAALPRLRRGNGDQGIAGRGKIDLSRDGVNYLS